MTRSNRPLRAVALHYDQQPSAAPKVVATGQGDFAQQIIAAARAAGIDIVEDPDLIEVLGRVQVGEDIPPELFQVVAEILAFLYRVNGRYSVEEGG